MALWATTVLFSFSRNLVCNLTTQKERRKRNPQQTSHNPKRGFQISTRAFHPQQGGLATVLQANTSPVSSPGSTLCCEDRQGLQLVRLPLQLELGPGLRGMKGWKRLQVDSERMKATSGEERGGPWTLSAGLSAPHHSASSRTAGSQGRGGQNLCLPSTEGIVRLKDCSQDEGSE